MAVYCKQGTSMKLPDSSGNCPAGFTKVDTGGGGGGGGGGGQNVPNDPKIPQPYDEDYPVWNMRPVGTAPAYTPGTGLNYLNDWQTKDVAEGSQLFLESKDQAILMSIAKAQGGRSIGPVWETFVDQSAVWAQAGKRMTPMELARRYAAKNGLTPAGDPSAGGSGSGGSGAAGPKPIDELGIRRAMDSVSTNLIGRTLSDKEFKQYYKSYTGAFSGDPGMDYQQHEVEAIKKEEDYQEMQVAQKFSKAFDSVLKGAM